MYTYMHDESSIHRSLWDYWQLTSTPFRGSGITGNLALCKNAALNKLFKVKITPCVLLLHSIERAAGLQMPSFPLQMKANTARLVSLTSHCLRCGAV